MILTYGALNLTATPYLIEFGTDIGAPENMSEALALLLQDGEIELSNRSSNRTLQFKVLIEGATLLALATAEANLVTETEKPLNIIALDPEDSGPVTLFDVFRGQVELQRDDNFERSRMRRYVVTVKAAPFVRSAAEVTTAALPATGATTTTLDTCSATTGWTGAVDGGAVSPATAGGAVTLTASLSGSITGIAHTMALQKTFAATTTTTKYLTIDWKPPAGLSNSSLAALGDGVNLPLLSEGPSPTSGYTRSLFYVAAASLAVTKLTWSGTCYTLLGSVTAVFSIDNVAVSNVNPVFGTGRQQARSLLVSGSARTQGSLAIESTTAALGDGTLVYVYPKDGSTNGYSPALRQFRLSGNTVTTNSALVSGSSEPLGASVVIFNIPIGLFPRGEYLLMVRAANSTGAATVIVTQQQTLFGATAIDTTGTTDRPVNTTASYQTFTLGRIQLPTVDLDPTAATAGAVMKLALLSLATCTYDEAWLFNISIGQLIQVNCGTGAGSVGGPARRLFIEPPTVATPRPIVRIGHSADRSDSFYPQVLSSWQFPEFNPPQVNVFVVTPNATDAALSLRHFPRWHTHAAS